MPSRSRPKSTISIEHHDWPTTLQAAKDLLELGTEIESSGGDKLRVFACLTGAMVLSVATLESFLNSMGHSEKLKISWDSFEKLSTIKKLKLIGNKLGIKVDKGRDPFKTIHEAIQWRHTLLHSKPKRVMQIEVDLESTDDVQEKTRAALPEK